MKLKDVKVSTTLVSIACLILIFSRVYYTRYDWVPLILDIHQAETSYEDTFKAEYTGHHSLYLEIDRLNGESKILSCIFGVSLQKSECNSNQKPANLLWEITEDGDSIASGEVENNWEAAYWSARGDGASIHRFSATEGSIYKLKIKLNVSQNIIEKVNPRMKIKLPALLHKDDAIISGLLDLLSYLILGLSVIALMIEVYRVKKRS